MTGEKRIEIDVGPTMNKKTIIINRREIVPLKSNNCYHCKIISATNFNMEIIIPYSIEIEDGGRQYYFCLDCLCEEREKIEEERKNEIRKKYAQQASKYNRKYHNGPYKGTCPICNKRAYWIHIPELAELNRIPFYKNLELAEKLHIQTTKACLDCFEEIWKGEE